MSHLNHHYKANPEAIHDVLDAVTEGIALTALARIAAGEDERTLCAIVDGDLKDPNAAIVTRASAQELADIAPCIKRGINAVDPRGVLRVLVMGPDTGAASLVLRLTPLSAGGTC